MEPTGVMDNKRQSIVDENDNFAPGDFTVCDLGDEEVHFSRHSSDFYYCQNDERKLSSVSEQHFRLHSLVTGTSHPTGGGGSSSSAKGARKFSNLSSLDAGHFGPDAYQQRYQHHDQMHTSEQISSSRLLNSLGSKLRRGSNYLNAPTRLLGHYLLGITIQSWSEFFNTARMMKVPGNRHQLTRRLLTNLNYFQGNYLCVSLILVIYCILTSPLLLIAIALYLLTLYLVTARAALGKQTRVFGYRLNLQQQYSFITMLSLPPLWIAGAPSAVFWVIGASFFVVGLHASMFSSEPPNAEQHLAGSSRANQSLAIHTPIQYLPQQSSYTQLGGNQRQTPTSAQSAAQYYNHYPGMAKSGYIPVSRTKAAAAAGPLPSGGASGYVSSAISQWIPFGGGRSSSSQVTTEANNASGTENYKTPEVKIISQDYAGLGRVYEV